ncbi:MAG: SgcJ/EcaC family oxidoreductase [Rhodospirillales bacterium]|nr:SgcJ/EcaC family oxidoreductase [Rhodospirillales bacterium]
MNAVSEAADRDIRALIPAWLDAVRRGDAAAIAQFYTPDGRFMVPNAPIAEGREAVAAMWAHLLALPGAALSFGPTHIEAAIGGDLAFEIGTYALGFDRDAKRVEDRGKYVVVWKRLDGSWKAAADILNSDLPAG